MTTLNMTPDDLAKLERLVNPDRDAIRAQAFEEAAKVADVAALLAAAKKDRKGASSTGGTAILTGYIFAETEAKGIAASIRSLAATSKSNGGDHG